MYWHMQWYNDITHLPCSVFLSAIRCHQGVRWFGGQGAFALEAFKWQPHTVSSSWLRTCLHINEEDLNKSRPWRSKAMKRSMPSKRALLKRAVIVSLFCSSGVQCAPFSRLPHFRGWWMTGAILFPEYAWKLNFLVFCVMGLILHFRKVFPNPPHVWTPHPPPSHQCYGLLRWAASLLRNMLFGAALEALAAPPTASFQKFNLAKMGPAPGRFELSMDILKWA